MKQRLVAVLLSMAFTGSALAVDVTLDPSSVSDSKTDAVFSTGVAGSVVFSLPAASGVVTEAAISAQMKSGFIGFKMSGPCASCLMPKASFYAKTTLDLGSLGSLVATSTTIDSGLIGWSGTSKNLAAYSTSPLQLTAQQQLDTVAAGISGTLSETFYISKTGGYKDYTMTGDNNPYGLRSATVSYTATTVNHANGSFNTSAIADDSNTLNLSFGTVQQNASPSSLGFNLYNVLGSFGLNVVSVTASGASPFSLDGIAGNTNLAAGSFAAGTVSLDTHTAGTYNSTWTITVADTAGAVGGGRNLTNTDVLTLNVSATVAAVPEPETYALFLAGLGLMGVVVRRRKAMTA